MIVFVLYDDEVMARWHLSRFHGSEVFALPLPWDFQSDDFFQLNIYETNFDIALVHDGVFDHDIATVYIGQQLRAGLPVGGFVFFGFGGLQHWAIVVTGGLTFVA